MEGKSRTVSSLLGLIIIVAVAGAAESLAIITYNNNQQKVVSSLEKQLSDKDRLLSALERQVIQLKKDQPKTEKELVNYNQDIRKQDLDTAFRQTLANPSSPKAEVIYAELTGDTIEEAVVQLRTEGQAGYLNQAVYTMSEGALKQLWKNTDTLAQSRGYVGKEQTVVLVGASSYEGAATTTDTFYSYKWNGATFVRQ